MDGAAGYGHAGAEHDSSPNVIKSVLESLYKQVREGSGSPANAANLVAATQAGLVAGGARTIRRRSRRYTGTWPEVARERLVPAGKQAGTGDPTREGTTTDRAPERATTEMAPRAPRFVFFRFFRFRKRRATLRARALNFPSISEHIEQQLPCITAARLGDGARPRIDRDGDG